MQLRSRSRTLPQARQSQLTKMTKTLPLRKRTTPRHEPGPGHAGRVLAHRRQRKPVVTEEEDSDCICVEVIQLDSDEAEEDDMEFPGADDAAWGSETSQTSWEAVDISMEQPSSIRGRPKGRLWFDHVQIPGRDPGDTDDRGSPPTRSTQTPASMTQLRQSHLDGFFKTGESPTANQGSATQSRDHSVRRSLRPRRPAVTRALQASNRQSTPDSDEWLESSVEESPEESSEDPSDSDEESSRLSSGPMAKHRQQTKSKPAKSQPAKSTTAKSKKTSTKPHNAVEKRNEDHWKYKCGVDLSLPPLHRLEDIFADMTAKAVRFGLDKAVRHLQGRNLTVATMCSGTESPMLALALSCESLKKHFDLTLNIEHQFSAEIVPFKQAYIERNFSPPVLFRDVREFMLGDEATTAYGAKVPVPRNPDIVVMGSSCVDFSMLNVNRKGLGDGGESGDTFRALSHYADKFRPKIIVLENVATAEWAKMQEALQSANYAAEWVKVDTKQYYIPHTRQRGYMVAIDKGEAAMADPKRSKQLDSMAKRWKELMTQLQRPASSPVEAFMLDEDDPRVHRGRQSLVRAATSDDRAKVEWEKCKARHRNYRRHLELGSKRPITGWEDNGSCKLPDYAWQDWGCSQVERIWDTLEISSLRNARRGFDSQYKSRVWELSQNIDRFTDTTAFGVACCVTPTGIPYLTNRGGPMIGLEALAMQGLPIERLLLTRETQGQLQDLAGNAMTSTVVGAALLAALIAGYETLEKGHGHMLAENPAQVKNDIRDGDHLAHRDLDLANFDHMPMETILSAVRRSVRLCMCEGRETLTSRKLQRCELCGHTACIKCGGNPKHKYAPLTAEELMSRIQPALFQDVLKNALPMKLTLKGLTVQVLETLEASHAAKLSGRDWHLLEAALRPALGAELRFHSLKRAQVWTVCYDSPNSRLELILDAVQAEWRLFAKPAAAEPGDSRVRQLLEHPFARMRPAGDGLLVGHWQFRLPITNSFKIQIKGTGELVRSWESMLGLQEPQFAEKKVWSKVRVDVPSEAIQYLDSDISGEYDLCHNCGTASGCLHKRQSEDALPLFLFLDPTRIGDPQRDCFVFSREARRLNYGEVRQTTARLDSSFRTSDEVEKSVKCQVVGQWVDCPEVNLRAAVPAAGATFAIPPADYNVEYESNLCEAANAILYCAVPVAGNEGVDWQKGPWKPVDGVNEREFFSSFAWLTERVRREPELETWKPFILPMDISGCERCAPRRPAIRWKIEDNRLTPYEDPQGAGVYERALKDRPAVFVTRRRIDDDNVGHLQIGLNIISLLHRAMASLAYAGNYGNMTASWRLVTDHEASSQLRCPTFTLKSNKQDPSCEQPPNFQVQLRPEQLRSLAWMKSQESNQTPVFVEEEVEEALLSHLGWRAEAKATKEIFVRGGVLADQVGYGKTAISLGLIDAQSQATVGQCTTEKAGKIPVKATLVVVPSQLVNQWRDEVHKFLGNKYEIMTIQTFKDLVRATMADFQNLDIIIVSWNVLTNENYLDKLAAFAAIPEMPSASGRAFDTWFGFAGERVAEHVELLKSDSENLQAYLRVKLAETENDESMKHVIPSKRLKGAQYLAAQQTAESEPPKKKQKTTGSSNGTAAVLGADPFGLTTLRVKKDWRKMKCPLFPMFHFNRLVIDEYTYLEGKDHTSIVNLQANTRWVLSGTPPLGDFADVKTISVFLGVNLGVDDDTSSVISSQNVKAIQRYRTDVENFQAFTQARSPAWHQRRHELAQAFLDRFVRQNIAEIDEIPVVEHIRPVVLPAAERAIYMELSQHLMAQDMRIRKVRVKADNDREGRLGEALGDSKTPEEALLKCCSHFTLTGVEKDSENAIDACKVVVKTRKAQYHSMVRDLRKTLKGAVQLKNDGDAEATHYTSWVENAVSNGFGDLEATAILKDLIESPVAEYAGQDPGTSGESDSIKTAKKGPPAKVAGQKRKRSTKDSLVPAERDDEVGDNEEHEIDAEESGPNIDVVFEVPESDMGKVPDEPKTLREMSTYLGRLSIELVSRLRSLRFFDAVRRLQLAQSGVDGSMEGHTCSKCNKDHIPVGMMSILTLCGHTACDSCLAEAAESNECVVAGCKAQASDFQIVRASELGEEDPKRHVGLQFGRKLDSVMRLILHEIPREEQAILFVQFEDLMARVEFALRTNGISYTALRAKRRAKASNVITDFQKNTGREKKRVLVLNLDDESASGANLVNANHVIFLSPLFVSSQYKYDSSMEQAIGRARRYGQLKVVNVYHFLSLKTIDVDIFEQRRGVKLVKEGDEYHLRKPNEVDFKLVGDLGSGMPRKQRQNYDN